MSDVSAATGSISKIMENRTKYADLFTDKRNDSISIETFYKLLMAEMSNQDPLEPMSNTDFISQMAQFTSLQVQQDALYFNNSSYAASMVGKEVIVAASTGTGLDVQSGIVSRVNFTGGEFKVTVNGKEYPLKNVMEVLDRHHGSPQGNDGAFATSLIGKYVTVGWLDGARAFQEEGIVERIEIDKGEITIIIGNRAYPLAAVIKVEPREVKPSNPDSDFDPDKWFSSEDAGKEE
jgi:flagellar basal-body rod modification protein FlgD